MIAFYVSVLALFIAIALVPLLARYADVLGLVDRPDARKAAHWEFSALRTQLAAF